MQRETKNKGIMKKVLFLLFISLLVSCNTNQMKYGQGGRNACQFVKEQVPELRDDIAKIEVIGEDSLLTDMFLDSGDLALHKGEVDYYEGRINRQQLDSIIESVALYLNDLEHSWTIGIVVNDSLRKLQKYSYKWCKAYKVKITMKSGVTKEPRVLMDQDGVTPYCMEKDIEKSIHEHVNTMTDVIRNIIY